VARSAAGSLLDLLAAAEAMVSWRTLGERARSPAFIDTLCFPLSKPNDPGVPQQQEGITS